jgi:negative regulator of genetic competence, sporulation and motility
LEVKKELYKACEAFIADKRSNIHDIMVSNQKALENEFKSSAGDKHETGRAMLHLEMEKASQQIAVVSKMQEVLERIDFSKTTDTVRLGSLIISSRGNYYLSISAGLIKIGMVEYFAVSTSSPIGNLLLGKKKGSVINLAEKQITILDIQ